MITIIGINGAIFAGNNVAVANQFGIIINSSSYARVERNTIGLGVKQDGIVVSDRDGVKSHSVYVGRNTVTSNQNQAGNPKGTGIWLNNESNGTLVYGNSTSGAPENGLTIFNTSNSWFWGNTTTGNGHGGVFIHGPVGLGYSQGPQPNNIFVQG